MCVVYTDGSFSHDEVNEANAGWACVIKRGTQIEVAYNHGLLETSNSAELSAIEMALHITRNLPHVSFKCDCKFLVSTLSKGVVSRKMGNTFKENLPGSLSAYHQQIHRILDLVSKRRVDFHWVKGHSDNEFNIIADSLAWIARTKPQKRTLKPIEFRYEN
jgi:ribonuclease HI